MVRRPARRGSGPRQARPPPVSVLLPTTGSAHSSSPHPSAYISNVDVEDDVHTIPIASLTLDTPITPVQPKRRVPITPFSFLLLPSELRLKIYAYYFDDTDGEVLDLGPDIYKRLHKRLGLMRVSKLVHAEATHYFYSTRTFRIFPTGTGKYFKTKKPLLARLKPIQRECITSLELRLGPGWSAPPRGWVVNEALGLKDCLSLHRLNVLVECDPSQSFFNGFRRSDGFYEGFSRNLLADVIRDLPVVDTVVFDAWSLVTKTGDMMHGLINLARHMKLFIAWGPQRGWTDEDEDEDEDRGTRKTASGYVEGILPEYASQNILISA